MSFSGVRSVVLGPALGAAFVAATIVACGGTVVFVEDDGAGAGGSSGQVGPQGPGVTTSVTTGPVSVCEQFCAAAAGCIDQDCASACQQFYVVGCEQQADALLQCFANNLEPGCDLPPGACEKETTWYDECVNGGVPDCTTDSCAFEECTCWGECFGGVLQASCGDFGSSSCDCYFDEQYIGSCDGMTCEIEGSCCQGLIFSEG